MIMMMKFLLSLTFLFAIIVVGKAQSTPSNLILIQAPQTPISVSEEVLDTLTNPSFLLTGTENMNYSASLQVSDTADIASIVVKVGTTQGGNDILESTFVYDSTPSGSLSYERDELAILLGLGAFVVNSTAYCEVYVVDAQGNQSAVTTYSSN